MTAKKSDVWKSVGRRKSSIARVMISSGKGEITINRRNIDTYFGGRDILKVVTKQPFEVFLRPFEHSAAILMDSTARSRCLVLLVFGGVGVGSSATAGVGSGDRDCA